MGFSKKTLLQVLITSALLLASCSTAEDRCIPASVFNPTQPQSIQTIWEKELADGLFAYMGMVDNGADVSSPIVIFVDNNKQRITAMPLMQFKDTPISMLWVNDGYPRPTSNGQTATRIHMIGYVPPSLYEGKTLFTAEFTFDSHQNASDTGNEFIFLSSAFQEGVIWFPITETDLNKFGYISQIYINTEESLSTDSAVNGDEPYSEWIEDFQPAINLAGDVISLDELIWVDKITDGACIAF